MPAAIASMGDANARIAVDDDLTGIGLIDAGEHVHERRLARTVLAEKGVDLAGPHLEVDVLVGDHAGKVLRDPAQEHDGRRARRRGRRSERSPLRLRIKRVHVDRPEDMRQACVTGP